MEFRRRGRIRSAAVDDTSRRAPARRGTAWLSTARRSHGFRSGVVLAAATLILSGSGYLFNVACIRYLGPSGYGDVAALMALAALASLPLGSVQLLIAREVADLTTRGAVGEVRRLLRRSMLVAVPLATALLIAGLVVSSEIESALKIGATSTVVAGLSVLVFGVVGVILFGFLQGSLRFGTLGVTYAASGMARPGLVVPALLLGFGAAGALLVNTIASALAMGLAAYGLRDLWFGPAAAAAPRLDRREVTVIIGGSLAFASLTNVDLLLASYYLSDREAGIYAAAAFVGKFVLFLPSAVTTVLLPKATSRLAAGRTARRILLASAGVTLVLTLLVAGMLALVPEGLLTWAFGPAFRDTTPLLGWFGLAMSAAALVNVYLSVYFAHRDARFPLLVAAAAVVQIVGIAVWHPSPRSVVLVTLACMGAIVVIHELIFPNRLVSVWRERTAAASSTPNVDVP
jgi:O-antigen/teichoic acid export membrane protein